MKRKPYAWGYGRGSTDRQVITMRDQEARVEEYGRALEGVAWGGMFKDPATSSSTPLAQRPAGSELLARLQRGDHVIVTHLDRAFRNFREAAVTMLQWKDEGVVFHITARKIDTSTSMGMLFMVMLAWMAEEEKAMIRERTRAAARRRKAEGGTSNGKEPYGFKVVGGRGSRRLAEDPQERNVMGDIVTLHDSRGMTFEQIWALLCKQGITTRKGKLWSFIRVVRAYHAELKLRKGPSTSSGA